MNGSVGNRATPTRSAPQSQLTLHMRVLGSRRRSGGVSGAWGSARGSPVFSSTLNSNDPADKVRGQRPAKRELRRALPALVGLEFFLERLDPARNRVEPYVFRVTCEVHQVMPVQVERGHRVADRLGGIGRCRLDECPQLFQHLWVSGGNPAMYSSTELTVDLIAMVCTCLSVVSRYPRGACRERLLSPTPPCRRFETSAWPPQASTPRAEYAHAIGFEGADYF